MSDNQISKEEFGEMPNIMGFKNEHNFLSFLLAQDGLYRKIEKKYNFTEMSPEDQFTFIGIGLNEGGFTPETTSCGTAYGICITKAIALNVVMQAGCTALDATVFGAPFGAACHVAALAYGLADVADCQKTRDDCEG